MTVSRRDFLGAGAAAAAGLALPNIAEAMPNIVVRDRSAPGARSPGGRSSSRPPTATTRTRAASRGSRSPTTRCRRRRHARRDHRRRQIVELDPTTSRSGSAAAERGGRGPARRQLACTVRRSARAPLGASRTSRRPAVAKAVMDYTDHIMLVGQAPSGSRSRWGSRSRISSPSRAGGLAAVEGDAQSERQLARSRSKPPTRPTARQADDEEREQAAHRIRLARRTVHVRHDQHERRDRGGRHSSVTTTSGISWKIPGRVGDSPIIGAGQYSDNEVGAAGSTGRGESNIKVCGAFLAVEFMRQGIDPQAALMKDMERVIAMTEKRLLDAKGGPYFGLQYYALNKKGEYAGAAAYEGAEFAVATRRARASRSAPTCSRRRSSRRQADQRRADQAVGRRHRAEHARRRAARACRVDDPRRYRRVTGVRAAVRHWPRRRRLSRPERRGLAGTGPASSTSTGARSTRR